MEENKIEAITSIDRDNYNEKLVEFYNTYNDLCVREQSRSIEVANRIFEDGKEAQKRFRELNKARVDIITPYDAITLGSDLFSISCAFSCQPAVAIFLLAISTTSLFHRLSLYTLDDPKAQSYAHLVFATISLTKSLVLACTNPLKAAGAFTASIAAYRSLLDWERDRHDAKTIPLADEIETNRVISNKVFAQIKAGIEVSPTLLKMLTKFYNEQVNKLLVTTKGE